MSNDITPGQNSDPSVPGYPGAAQPPVAPPTYEQGPAYAQPPAYEQPQGYAQAQGYPQSPGYAQAPAYGQPAYGGYPMAPKNNTLAIVALVSAIASLTLAPFIGSIVAVITGHMSLSQIKFSGEGGRGMALAGVIIGWIGVAGLLIGIIALVLFIPWVVAQSATY